MQKFHFSTTKTLVNAAVYFLLFLAGDLLSSLPFDLIFSFVTLPGSEWYVILRMLGCLLLTLLLFWVYTIKRLHLKMEDFGITFGVQSWGIVLAVLLPAFVVMAFLIVGKAEINPLVFSDRILVVVASMLTALKAGILEEMLFRGFIMKLLENRWGKTVAILLPSFLFSLAHIPSMESFTVGGVMLLAVSGTLVGVMFSLVAYQGGSISNNALIHSVWNFVMVTSVLHISTAQGAYGEPLVQIVIPSDNILLTGAGFGPEASLISIVGYLLICGILIFRKKQITPGASKK
ncbi:MAG: CPBP family intramembrane metalloprotease [Provencibacterium sp.]|nr:CPBP family intramembrane metalloprotease [Provencibacterium sp.]